MLRLVWVLRAALLLKVLNCRKPKGLPRLPRAQCVLLAKLIVVETENVKVVILLLWR